MQDYDIEQIKRSIELIKPNGELYEIRILQGTGKKKKIISGYFKGTKNLEQAFKTVNLKNANVFYSLNQIDASCYAREQHEKFVMLDDTTSDRDIVAYSWLLVDIDPNRRSGISSTNEELKGAQMTAQRVRRYMINVGFADPIVALSGNGVHLLFAINLACNDENENLVKNCLGALAVLFNDEVVSIDTSVFNPARISKLYGTMARKGADTEERPHRMSRVVLIPDEIKTTNKDILELLASEMPKEPERPAQKIQKPSKQFNVEEWLSDNFIHVSKITSTSDGATKYILEECPFDSSHKAPDSMVIVQNNGAIGFKCLHNSCMGRTWQDLRLKFEPDAYDNKNAEADARIEAGWKEHKKFLEYNRNRSDIVYKTLDIENEDENNPIFETLEQIGNKPMQERVCIQTGIKGIDSRIEGLAKGEITCISGVKASAKSTVVSQICLNAIQSEHNTLVYSGELNDRRFRKWFHMQAAGLDYIKPDLRFPNSGYLSPEIGKRIDKWVSTRLKLYNNDYGNSFKGIATALRRKVEQNKADLVVIDNMSILDISDISQDGKEDKYDKQRLFVEMLKAISIECDCHIIFVAHPRKSIGFIRSDDISGSGNIGNLVDNILIVHRNNEDFRRLSKQMFRWSDDHIAYSGTNVIEIAKDREYGTQDVWVPLWYQERSRRLLNSKTENITYGWNMDSDGFIEMPADESDLPWI